MLAKDLKQAVLQKYLVEEKDALEVQLNKILSLIADKHNAVLHNLDNFRTLTHRVTHYFPKDTPKIIIELCVHELQQRGFTTELSWTHVGQDIQTVIVVFW